MDLQEKPETSFSITTKYFLSTFIFYFKLVFQNEIM